MKRFPLTLYLALLACLTLCAALMPVPAGPSVKMLSAAPRTIHVINPPNLRNTVTNFGSFGSITKPYPSCEWPAWSQNLYLNEGELWVGGVISGDTAVTTARFSGQEWYATQGIGIMPELSSFSDEDTYTRYSDLPEALDGPTDHMPLGLLVSQRNLAWAGADFIVHDMIIENVGFEDITDVYVGFCWDFNIARMAGGYFAGDDLVGLDDLEAISYMYDDDGDGGLSPGHIGGSYLNAPLAGHAWWARDDEPLDDRQRYLLMSGGMAEDPSEPDDYRLVHSVGPIDFPVGRKIPLIYALAIGNSPITLRDAVLDAADHVGRAVAAFGDSILYEGETHTIPVILGETKLKALGRVQLAVDWEFCDVGLTVVNPAGELITPETALTNPLVSYVVEPHRKAYEIVSPLLGEWLMNISYITAEAPIIYRHTVTVFGIPWDFGEPMADFSVTRAYIRFPASAGDMIYAPGGFRVWADMALAPDRTFDHTQDAVLLQMGSYQELIPPGSFTPWGPPGSGVYTYGNDNPGNVGIYHMVLNFNKNWFRAYAKKVDLTGTENPVLVRLAIGSQTGFENVPMQESGYEWFYPPQ